MNDDDDTGSRTAIVKDLRPVFKGFLSIVEADVSYPRGDGKRVTITRQCMERGDAAAVLCVDRARGSVLLVEQFRFPTLAKGPGWIIETPAGMINAEETPEATAARETFEETGVTPQAMEHIATFYVSPGGTSERIYLYFAEISLSAQQLEAAVAQRDPDEDIALIEVPIERFIDDAIYGRALDAKTLIGGLWLAAHRARLGL